MKVVKVLVPDDDCKGCDFLAYSSYESHYQSYTERYYCQVFKCDIQNNQKCNACALQSAMQDYREKE